MVLYLFLYHLSISFFIVFTTLGVFAINNFLLNTVADFLMNKNLSYSIGILMKEKGINLAELAKTLNIPKATLHKIVTGKSARPHHKTLRAISEYFKIPIPQLLEGKVDRYGQAEKIKHVPIIDWENIMAWIAGQLKEQEYFQTTPTNLDIDNSSFALVFNDMSNTIFKQNSVLIFDPTLEIKDGAYVLVKLAEHPIVLLRQVICDASNEKYLKSLNQEFSTNIKKVEASDRIIAVLVMAKTLFYHK